MGRHLVSGVDAQNQAVTVMAETALAAGDYAKLGTGGFVRRAADGVPLALQNSASGVTALVPPAAVEASGTAWGRSGFNAQMFRSIVALDNGNFAVVYSGNGSQSDTGVNLRIYGPLRVPLSSRVVVAAATGVVGTRLARAGADNIAVLWVEGATLKLAIHSAATGAVVAPEVTVAPLANSDISTWNVATLNGGDVVLAYGKSGSNDFAFKRFNAAGLLQGAEVVVEAGSSSTHVGVLALASGGFVLHYYRYAAATAYKFVRFAANGTQQGELNTLATGSPNRSVSPAERNAMELSNGNLVFVDPAINTSAAVRLYDAIGNFLSTLLVATGAAGMPNAVCICPRQFGGFWLAVGGQLYEYDNAGASLRQSVAAGFAPFMLIDRAGNGPVMVSHLVGGGFTVVLSSWSADLSTVENTLTLSTSSSYPLSYAWTEVLSNGMLGSVVCGQPSTGAATIHLSVPQAASILGIAQETIAAGTVVRVATTGKFLSTQSFSGPAFDRRTAVPPGTRGVAVGNSAILGGLAG
ncbi:hypothetical protein LJR066_001142 [Acidovorax sp. LjRoot66]|uniref:hypothetical protein n=1 Tax=Acidovorax sp. LjRoot66 TaxID=3342334 RepID=UPI003ECF4C64